MDVYYLLAKRNVDLYIESGVMLPDMDVSTPQKMEELVQSGRQNIIDSGMNIETATASLNSLYTPEGKDALMKMFQDTMDDLPNGDFTQDEMKQFIIQMSLENGESVPEFPEGELEFTQSLSEPDENGIQSMVFSFTPK